MTDYISREKFIATCVDVYCKNCDRRKNGKGKMVYDIGGTPCRSCDIMTVLNDIECFPSADVAPVRHGTWLPIVEANEDGSPYQAGVFCSECGHPECVETNYCCYCGAVMDGGKKNAE